MSTPVLTRGPQNPWAMIRTLGVVSLLSGVLIVLVYQATEARIAANRRQVIEDAVFRVIPGAVKRVTFAVGDAGFTRMESADFRGAKVYAGYDASGKLLGIAIEGAAQGYGDMVRALYGYDPVRQCVIGMTVVESKETPGFGDRLGTDPVFVKNFEALDVQVNADGSALAHSVELVKRGTKTQAWQIDGITGVTISSRAVTRLINDSAQEMIPLIHKHLDQFGVQ
jgi:Na+-translocating ferredoxin:NAD+ oxidoreductase subunit G